MLCLFAGMASAAGELQLKEAPLSPAFLAYREGLKQKDTLLPRGVNPGEKPKGYLPSPVDLSHLKNADYSAYFAINTRRGVFPERYDLREVGAVTPVKNQNPYNNCWAFSAIGSIESAYMKKTGTELDLSEMHLSYYAYMDPVRFTSRSSVVLDNGGFDNISVATMARWTGPVLETSAPYNDIPTGPSSKYTNRLHLQDAYFLSLQMFADQPQPTNDIRKELIMSQGAISVAYYASGMDAAYNETTSSWYNRGVPSTSSDHAVLAVGWDDTYPKENFNANLRPLNNGAWLIKNSWGTGWGQKGYFWLSYEDSSLGDGTVYIPEETTNYDNIYDYDDLGWCNSFGEKGGNVSTAWMANVFKAGNSEVLKAISLYTTNTNATYEISVYTALKNASNPASGTLVSSQTGSQPLAGYHTVKLNTPVSLAKGTTFAVIVKMTTPSYGYPMAVEYPIQGYSDNAVVNRGESFFSFDGAAWLDGAEYQANACIKAFTSNSSTPTPDPDPDPTPDPGSEKKVVSESASDWATQTVQMPNAASYAVTFTGRIDVTAGDISNVTVFSTGLSNVAATVDNIPRSDAPQGRTYYTLYINGTTDNPNSVSLLGLSFTQQGTQYSQTFASPIWLKTRSSEGRRSGGSGGCNAAPGALLALAFLPLLLRRK